MAPVRLQFPFKGARSGWQVPDSLATAFPLEEQYEVWRNQKPIINAIFHCPEPDSKPKRPVRSPLTWRPGRDLNTDLGLLQHCFVFCKKKRYLWNAIGIHDVEREIEREAGTGFRFSWLWICHCWFSGLTPHALVRGYQHFGELASIFSVASQTHKTTVDIFSAVSVVRY
jgi:hypothetical protein